MRILLPLLALALLGACGEPERGSVPEIASASAERVVEDGAATLESTVTVSFDRPFELVESRLPLASHFELEVPRLDGGPRRVLVREATLSETSSREIVLEVDSLIPAGSVLKVAARAFRLDDRDEMTIEVESELTPELVVLASTALSPSGPEIFDPPVNRPATEEDRDPAKVRQTLEAYLEIRGASPAVREAVFQTFETLPVEIVPHPKIRAALAALRGTFAEPAIDSLFTENNCTEQPAELVAFQPPPGGENLVAQVTHSLEGQRIVSLLPELESERFEHLMPILVHEAIHCDERAGVVEEVAAVGFDTFFYVQLIAMDSSLVGTGTRLARDLSLNAIAFINSGRRLPESVGILRSVGVERALPNTTAEMQSFGDLVAAAYQGVGFNEGPSEALALEYARLLSIPAGMQSSNPFDLRYLDELLGRATDVQTMAAAVVALDLRLDN